MFTQRYTINLRKKDQEIKFRPLGDIHIGNLGCDEAKLEKNIKFIADNEDYYTIGMGDYIDNVMAYAGGTIDKRWNPETINRKTLTTEEQTDRFLELWEPIKEKSLGLHAGNHEWKTINQRRFIKDFCEPLNQRYLGRLAYTCLSFKYKGKLLRDYLILSMHGGYSGMMAGGAVNRMKLIAGDFDFDLVLMGHNHDTWTRTGLRIGYDKKTNNAVEKKVMYANTGTFLKGYEKGVDSYVEINPREAKRVGTITISFIPNTGEIFSHD